jgi:hypothetical protein
VSVASIVFGHIPRDELSGLKPVEQRDQFRAQGKTVTADANHLSVLEQPVQITQVFEKAAQSN